MHADLIRKRGVFSEVHCAFLKEEPLIRDALDGIKDENITIIPDFLAEGYFTQQVIPDLLRLDSRQGNMRYCKPVGVNPMMQELIRDAAADVLGCWDQREVTLLVIGHGSTKNKNSKQSLLGHLDALVSRTDYAQIADLWLDEAPLVVDWKTIVTQPRVVVVPFLLSDGQHGEWDIPWMLGIEGDGVHTRTHRLGNYELRVAPALGTSARFAEAIVQMV